MREAKRASLVEATGHKQLGKGGNVVGCSAGRYLRDGSALASMWTF